MSDLTRTVAQITNAVIGLTDRAPEPLPGHLKQAETGNVPHLNPRPITL